MKVIDLLNKIANGEEVPKEIRYRDENLYFDYETSNYYNDEDMHSLFCEVQFILNNEVEIIEEDKEIEELVYKSWSSFSDDVQEVYNKVNELIKVLNELKKGK